MTKSDAGVFTHACQARAAFVTHCTPVIVKIRMALDVCEKGEKVRQDVESTHPYQGLANMSTGKLEVAWHQAATCRGVRKAMIPMF